MDEQMFLVDLAKLDPTLHTDLAKLARRWPQLTTRATRAAYYYLNDRIDPTPAGDYYVRSDNRERQYTVTGSDISCNCPDIAHNGAPPGPGNRAWCKHMIACVFHYRYQSIQREV